MTIQMINGALAHGESGPQLQSSGGSILLQAGHCNLFLLQIENNKRYVMPVNQLGRGKHAGHDILWILPEGENSPDRAMLLQRRVCRMEEGRRLSRAD